MNYMFRIFLGIKRVYMTIRRKFHDRYRHNAFERLMRFLFSKFDKNFEFLSDVFYNRNCIQDNHP